MANILLTHRCNRSCPYCFATGHQEGDSPENILTWDSLVSLINLLKKSDEKRVFFLGGEPSLHPQMVEFCLYSISRGVRVTMFSNGIWSEALLAGAGYQLLRLPKDMFSIVCNLNQPDIASAAELVRVHDFLSFFGNRVTTGFNIYRSDFDIAFVFEYIRRFGLQSGIRIGLAHPTPGKTNCHLKISDLPKAVSRLMSYGPDFSAHKISLFLDCGFPRCLFSDDDISLLSRLNSDEVHFGCSPIIDIGPDMKVWSCFPLIRQDPRPVIEFASFDDIYLHYENKLNELRTDKAGIFRECEQCHYRKAGECAGGCLGHLT